MAELTDISKTENATDTDMRRPQGKFMSKVASGSEDEEGIFAVVIRPCLAEAFGLLMFVFIGGMSIGSTGGVVSAALAHGFTIFLLVASLGHISGGHFNPAVTLGLVLTGGIKPVLAIFYVISQCIGGIIGAACVKGAMNNATYFAIGGGANTLNYPSASPGMGILCETLTTAALVSVVLGTALDTKGKNVLAPLAIGITVAVDILATANISGASMNPARSLGPAIVAGIVKPGVWTYHYINWVGPLLGSILASLFYRFVFAAPDRRLP